jgi:hypothetical protein
LGVPVFRAAVELIAGVMGTLPVSLYRPADGGGKGVADDHPGQILVEDDANGRTSAGEFRSPEGRRAAAAELLCPRHL